MPRPDKSLRSRQLAQIHIGAKAIGLDPNDKDPDSAYRAMLIAQTGKASSGKMSTQEREKVLTHLEASGWKSGRKQRPKKGNARARLIHHIWNCLADAEVVHHKDALSAWLISNTKADHPGNTGWERPEFLPDDIASRIIEQLKKWAKREQVNWQ